MELKQFRILYREFLFRVISPELLSRHAQGDSLSLLAQILSLLVFISVLLALQGLGWSSTAGAGRMPEIIRLAGTWTNENFLIATTMLAVGIFAVLSWDSFFPDRRDALVLGPFPIRLRTLLFAKVCAVAASLGVTVVALHSIAGLVWPFVLSQANSAPAPALLFEPALPPVSAVQFGGVLDRDIAPFLRELRKNIPDGQAAVVIGVSTHGTRRVMAYGAGRADSLFEIGSVSKTFTGLLLAQMAAAGDLDLRDPVRQFLPPGTVAAPRKGSEITLLDLATHYSGLPSVPPEAQHTDAHDFYTGYRTADLLQFVRENGVGKKADTGFEYSNLGYALLGYALSNRTHTDFATLVRDKITGPLGMAGTMVRVSESQRARFLVGHDEHGRAIPPWDLDAFTSAGGLRSSAGDLLTYLEAQLHPDRTPFGNAIRQSHLLRNYVSGDISIALAWIFNPDTGMYEHSGATGGFYSYVCFDPKRDLAAVALLNAYPSAVPGAAFLGDHIRQRLDGEPAVSLDTVMVKPSGPIRNFLAYWLIAGAVGAFTLCTILSLQGISCWLLPRRAFLRVSGVLQLAIFSALLFGYFTLSPPAMVLLRSAHQPWQGWIPTYWFVGLYQQLSGSLHPALRPFAHRAWIGLAGSFLFTATFYAAAYRRGMQGILEEPDIAPPLHSRWLPRFADRFQTAVVQFAIRGLLRSARHRVILSFYVGVGLALALLYLRAPSEIAGPTSGNAWQPFSTSLLASTFALLGATLLGVRKAFLIPVNPEARWMFRASPVHGGRPCLAALRRAYYAGCLVPVWAVSAITLLVLWPIGAALLHLAVLALLGLILIEVCVGGMQFLPLCCSFLPGRSKLHVTFWLWGTGLFVGLIEIAAAERLVLQRPFSAATLFSALALADFVLVWRNNRQADAYNELRFEEAPADELLALRLSE